MNDYLTFQYTDADAATLDRCAQRYRERIGAAVPAPVIEQRGGAFVLRYPLPEAQGIEAQDGGWRQMEFAG